MSNSGWFIVHVMPTYEELIASRVRDRLELPDDSVRVSRRPDDQSKPLYPGYVEVWLDDLTQIEALLAVGGVTGIVGTAGEGPIAASEDRDWSGPG